MHELPQLRKLEDSYRDVVTIVGVQSPKYPAEAEVENLRAAVQRYGIEHAVVNDPDYVVWDAYAVKAWPTLVFVSPTGTVVGIQEGEAPFEELDRSVRALLDEFDGDMTPARRSGWEEAVETRPTSQLSFPGSVTADANRLMITDSGHHRILICDREGTTKTIVGSGSRGLTNGTEGDARFDDPQGMAIDQGSDVLYVADAGNHAIRSIDLKSGAVTTVAGTGEQARTVLREGRAGETPLSSPWGLALWEGTLYVAMAGLHQVWALDLAEGIIRLWAGTGHEGLRDGSRTSAWLAQPMAVCTGRDALFAVSAESQAVQSIGLSSSAVTTLVGRGLFDFGDVDGPGSAATLQHPQGVAYVDGTLFVADTYNNKLKTVDCNSGNVRTVAGSGRIGMLDGPGANARLAGPSGLCALGETIYLADTNNHLIRRFDSVSGHISTVNVRVPERL